MPTPQLGYGGTTEVNLDHFNIWMRTQPWYQQLITSFGQDPRNVHLNDQQKTAVVRAAQAHGAIIDEGKQEVDDSGNFRNQGHKLRNTLIVAGIVGASIATMGAAGVFAGAAGAGSAAGGAGAAAGLGAVEGGAYGIGAGTVAALGTGAMGAVPVAAGLGGAAGAAGTAAATTGAFDAAGNFVGPSTYSAVGGGSGGSSMLGMTSGDLVRYGLPVAGNLVGSLIQANAEGKASDAQQKYLEEALAYQKEQDAYTRQREAGRYADYEGRIAPYLATGASANDRMATLLGLPAAPGGASGSATYATDLGTAPSQFADAANRIHPELALDVDPTSDAILYRGQPIDVTVDSGKGGWSFRPSGPVNPSYAARLTPTVGQITTGRPAAPIAAPALVTVRAPTGQTRQVPQSEVPHWVSRGATVVQEAA
jgi:hypothetical protein